jgi:3-hydroxyisobutyrate dehydrogenase-like beta-hydroxyacid dehydrogenase
MTGASGVEPAGVGKRREPEADRMSQARVGFCGMGTMGAAMAANIARAGFPWNVRDRTPGRAALPISLGAALPVTALASQVEAGLVARGHGSEDDSALARAIRDWSGM